jgi:hypothetical protein
MFGGICRLPEDDVTKIKMFQVVKHLNPICFAVVVGIGGIDFGDKLPAMATHSAKILITRTLSTASHTFASQTTGLGFK